jgi:hypothetical protein
MTVRAQSMPPKIRTGRLYTKMAARLAGSANLSVMEVMPVGFIDVNQARKPSTQRHHNGIAHPSQGVSRRGDRKASPPRQIAFRRHGDRKPVECRETMARGIVHPRK